MSQRTEEVRAGVMVFLGFALFVGALLFIFGAVGPRNLVEYRTILPYSGGVEPGTDVRFGGMKVGRVASVELSPTHPTLIEMALRVEEGTPVRADSVAQVTSLTMLGNNYIEISTGTPTAAILAPGSYLEGKPPANMGLIFAQAASALEQAENLLRTVNEDVLTRDMENLRTRMKEIFTRAQTLLDRMNDVLNDENRANFASALADARGLLDDNREDIRKTIANMQQASQELQTLLAHADGVVADAGPEVQALLVELQETAEHASALTANLDAILAENRESIAVTTGNLAATSANVRDLTETLAREPWRLFWRTQQPERVAITVSPEQ